MCIITDIEHAVGIIHAINNTNYNKYRCNVELNHLRTPSQIPRQLQSRPALLLLFPEGTVVNGESDTQPSTQLAVDLSLQKERKQCSSVQLGFHPAPLAMSILCKHSGFCDSLIVRVRHHLDPVKLLGIPSVQESERDGGEEVFPFVEVFRWLIPCLFSLDVCRKFRVLITDGQVLLNQRLLRQINHRIKPELPLIESKMCFVVHHQALVIVQPQPGVSVDPVVGVRGTNIYAVFAEVFEEVQRGVCVDAVVASLREPVVVVHFYLVVDLVSVNVALSPPGQGEPESQLVIDVQVWALPSQFLLHFHVSFLGCWDARIDSDMMVVAEVSLEHIGSELVEGYPIGCLDRRWRGVEEVVVHNGWGDRGGWRRRDIASCDRELCHVIRYNIIY